MGRPFRPEQGLNRSILLLVRRQPGAWPGTVSRVLGHDGNVVRGQLLRLVRDGYLRVEQRDGHDCHYLTEAGEQLLRRRTRPPRGGSPYRSPAVHS